MSRTILFAILAVGLAATALPRLAWCDDEWQEVTPARQIETAKSPTKSQKAPIDETAAARAAPVIACGEEARPGNPLMTSIMAWLTAMFGVRNVLVYESIRPLGPHAAAGGCVFYNPANLGGLLANWMRIDDQKRVAPMLYAILAHELGHEIHNDFDPQRRQLGTVRCELEADQFAGYTLSRLNIRAEDIADYYRVTGDDFFPGISGSHGRSTQRVEAFLQGWKRGEMGLSEQSVIGVGGEDHP